MISRRDFMKLVGGSGAVLTMTACGGGSMAPQPPQPNLPPPSPPPPPPPPAGVKDRIEHIIFTMQENRSFDHYFGHLPQYRRMRGIPGDLDGLPENASNPALDDPQQLIFSYHIETPCHENLTPSWNASRRQWNRFDPTSPVATLDGFVYTAARFTRDEIAAGRTGFDTEGRRAMGFYDDRDLPFYYELASQFATSDRMFSSVLGATLINRMYLIAGSSFGRAHPGWPCPVVYQQDTIFDVCERHGISWKIYNNNKSGFTYYSWFRGKRSHENDGKIVRAEQFFIDAAEGNLPQVAMFESGTDTGLDEHPKNDAQRGSAYMRRFFKALMEGPAWNKTAAFLTYDEGGGFFDHVVPPEAVAPDDIEPILRTGDEECDGESAGLADTPGNFRRYGYRVPFIAVSPWVKRHHVSHAVADHTSILKFIETRFNLPSLTRRDAEAHDLLDMFDFSSPQLEIAPPLPEQPWMGDDGGRTCSSLDWPKV